MEISVSNAAGWQAAIVSQRLREPPLFVLLPEQEARFIRVDLLEGPRPGYAIAELTIKDLAFGASPNAFFQALVYAGLGDKDRTLTALDRVAELGGARIGRALNSPEFALLRGDPRVKALRRKVGLPE